MKRIAFGLVVFGCTITAMAGDQRVVVTPDGAGVNWSRSQGS
jgi:hypothetical protein